MLAQRLRPAGNREWNRAQTVCSMSVMLLWICAGAVVEGRNTAGLVAKASLLTGNEARRAEMTNTDTVVVERLGTGLDAEGFPGEGAWQEASMVKFREDWRGENSDPARGTEVRVLWDPKILYVRFDARYKTLTFFPNADTQGRRDELWNRDVCEAFLQPDFTNPRRYKEFEVAPNGFWIDLDIAPGEKHDLRSGLRRRTSVNEAEKRWRAELAIPMQSLTAEFKSSQVWRANFYRVEGPTEPRFYSAWRPTHSPEPNFHVPEAFGKLRFEDDANGKKR